MKNLKLNHGISKMSTKRNFELYEATYLNHRLGSFQGMMSFDCMFIPHSVILHQIIQYLAPPPQPLPTPPFPHVPTRLTFNTLICLKSPFSIMVPTVPRWVPTVNNTDDVLLLTNSRYTVYYTVYNSIPNSSHCSLNPLHFLSS